MNAKLREALEKELLGWPGVGKKTNENGPGGGAVTGYRYGGRQLGHVHHAAGGLADFSFPQEVRDELIRAGRAVPHPAFPNSRTDASHELQSEGDLREVIALFRINYERARRREEERARTRTRKETT